MLFVAVDKENVLPLRLAAREMAEKAWHASFNLIGARL